MLPAVIVRVVPEVVVATLRSELMVCVVQPVPVFDSPMLMFWATVKVWAVFVAVAGALMTRVVAFVMLTIVAPAGMPRPLIPAPTTMPAVLVPVTVVELRVVAAFASVWA